MKKKICLTAIIFMMIIGMSVVNAKISSIEISADGENNASSASCSTDVCMRPIGFYGIAVTIIDSNGNIKYSRKNIWNNTAASNFAKLSNSSNRQDIIGYTGNLPNGYSNATCTSRYLYKNMSGSNDSRKGLFSNSNNLLYVSDYASFINSFSTTQIGYILDEFGLTLDKVIDYYLKIEPIYVLQEKWYTSCNYFVGTTFEILSFRGKNEFTPSSTRKVSDYESFMLGGNNTYIGGPWNVVRNRIVNPYYSCNSKLDGLNITCYNESTSLANYKAQNKNVSNLLNLYKNGNGLGVGYVGLKDFIKNGKLIINKTDQSGKKLQGATFTLYSGKECKSKNELKSATTNAQGQAIFSSLSLGDYSYKETKSPTGYDINNACSNINIKNIEHSVTVTNKKTPNDRYLKVKKVDSDSKPISNVDFMLCDDYGNNCIKGKTNQSGIVSFKLNDKLNYDLRLYEKIKLGYSTNWLDVTCNKGCKTKIFYDNPKKDIYDGFFEIFIDDDEFNKEITIINVKTCVAEFNNYREEHGSVDMAKRIEMYRTYNTFNNLLNMGETEGTKACAPVSCSNNDSKASCLNGSINSTFSSTNLSCYNNIVRIGSGDEIAGYCQTSLNFNKDENVPDIFSAIRGELFNVSGLATTGTLITQCYLPNYDRNKTYKLDADHSSLIKNVELDYYGNKLVKDTIAITSNPTYSNNILTLKTSYRYYFNPVYTEIGSGKLYNYLCYDCAFLRNGILSNREDDKTSGKMNFKYTFNLALEGAPLKDKDVTKTGTCDYRLGSGIYPPPDGPGGNPSLNLEFRIIDTKNPFPGMSGIGRNTKSNWCGVDNSGNEDCSNDNSTVKENITNKKNSYAQAPKYVIELTPSDIKKIREYNKTTTYGDRNYKYYLDKNTKSTTFEECRKGTNCKIRSVFLENLISKKVVASDSSKTWYLDNSLIINNG